jgi:hypothetical protein
MSLTLKFCIAQSDDCKSFRFVSKTGVYSATIPNLGGYGAPNPTVASALTATVLIEKRNSDGTYTALNAGVAIDVYPTLPSSADGYFEITAEAAGNGVDSSFTDGVYRLTYTVTGDDGGAYTATTAELVPLVCSIMCCWKKLALKTAQCTCSCETLDQKFTDLALDFRLLQAAQDAGDATTMSNLIDSITKSCGAAGCGCSGCN